MKTMFGKILILLCIALVSVPSVFADTTTTPAASAPTTTTTAATTAKTTDGAAVWGASQTQGSFGTVNFMIDTDDFSVGWSGMKDSTAEKTTNKVFGIFIQKMMIALWVLSLFIMTVGAWYMMVNYGQDEYLSRGKSIFKMGIVSLVVALSSYYMVNLVGYLLYK